MKSKVRHSQDQASARQEQERWTLQQKQEQEPAEFNGRSAVAANPAARAYMPPSARTAARPGASNAYSRPVAPIHPNDLPRTARPGISNTGSPKMDKKYEQEQERTSVQSLNAFKLLPTIQINPVKRVSVQRSELTKSRLR
jgi:hypothetical protein